MSFIFSNDVFPPTSTTLFRQTAAPIGWTKVTTYNDRAIRVVTGVGGGVGGVLAFSSVYRTYSIGAISNATLTSSDNVKHYHESEVDNGSNTSNALWNNTDVVSSPSFIQSESVGGGTHNHGTKSIDLRVNYIDVILATKQ